MYNSSLDTNLSLAPHRSDSLELSKIPVQAMSGRVNFHLVQLSELEESFSRTPNAKDLRQLSRTTGIPKELIVHEVVFAAPDCTLANQYMQWTKQHDLHHMFLKTKTMSTTNYINVHGEDAVRKFLLAMITHGHPYQPVRVVRDARQPITDSLDDTVTYVAP